MEKTNFHLTAMVVENIQYSKTVLNISTIIVNIFLCDDGQYIRISIYVPFQDFVVIYQMYLQPIGGGSTKHTK